MSRMRLGPAPMLRGQPEYVFATLLAVFGIIFAFGMPPIQTPDEPSHFHRAYQVSEGILVTHPVGEWGGADIPNSVLKVAEHFSFLVFHYERQTTAEPFQALAEMPLNPDERRAVPLPGSAYYSFVPYVPQAIGIALARGAGCGPLGLLYAGRLANLVLAVVLVFFAIRIMPVFKLVLGMVALLPITVQQVASLNADGSTIGVGFLMTAFFVRCALAVTTELSRRQLATLFGLAIWLTLCKFPFAFLSLLYLGIPVERLGNTRRYLAVGACLFLMIFGLAGGLTQLRKNTPDRLVPANRGASISQQTHYIRTHPVRYAKILASTGVEHGKVYFDQMFMLGWLDTPVNPLTQHLYLIFMVIVALGDRMEKGAPTWRLVGVGVIASVLCWTVILTSCYVVGCPVRSPLIPGPQGRYFLPFLTLLFLPLYNRVMQVRVDRRILEMLTEAACTGVLLMAVVTFVRRYYFVPPRQPLFDLVGFTAAATIVGMVALVCWWHYGREEEETSETSVYADRISYETVAPSEVISRASSYSLDVLAPEGRRSVAPGER